MNRQRRQARRRLSQRVQHTLRPRGHRRPLTNPGARLASLCLLVCSSWALYWFGTSDQYLIQGVVVEGNTTTPSEAIAEASGAESVNAFQLSLSEVVDRVRALSSLREARATFDWPNGIRLTVSEREPLFVWESGGRRYYVDEAGYLFPVRGAPTLLVTIRDLDSQPRTRLDERIVTAIRLLTRELPGIAHFEFSAVRGLSFQNEQGWKVIFGRPEKMETKLAVISALTRYFAAQKIDTEYLDVRLPERAFYKPK